MTFKYKVYYIFVLLCTVEYYLICLFCYAFFKKKILIYLYLTKTEKNDTFNRYNIPITINEKEEKGRRKSRDSYISFGSQTRKPV